MNGYVLAQPGEIHPRRLEHRVEGGLREDGGRVGKGWGRVGGLPMEEWVGPIS